MGDCKPILPSARNLHIFLTKKGQKGLTAEDRRDIVIPPVKRGFFSCADAVSDVRNPSTRFRATGRQQPNTHRTSERLFALFGAGFGRGRPCPAFSFLESSGLPKGGAEPLSLK